MHDLVDLYINYHFRIKVRIYDLVNGREISVLNIQTIRLRKLDSLFLFLKINTRQQEH